MNIHERNVATITQDTYNIECNVLSFIGGITFVTKSFDDICTLDDVFNQRFRTQMVDAPNGKWHLHIFNTSNPYQ